MYRYQTTRRSLVALRPFIPTESLDVEHVNESVEIAEMPSEIRVRKGKYVGIDWERDGVNHVGILDLTRIKRKRKKKKRRLKKWQFKWLKKIQVK